MLLSQFIREGSRALEALYPPQEARSLVTHLLEETDGYKDYFQYLNPSLPVSDTAMKALERLLAGEPLQYVTGVQEFYGRRFHVGPGVLVPRPETEILVREAVVSALSIPGGKPRVLDLCTGSGCIAWSIALEVPTAEVLGIDLSEQALDYARGQFSEGSDRVRFVLGDITADDLRLGEECFDIITANPPYIRESEKSQMHRNVLEHEPGMALFVPDGDPLVFYRHIARHAHTLLSPGGFGIVEINESLGAPTAALFSASGFRTVHILRDLSRRDRFVTFR